MVQRGGLHIGLPLFLYRSAIMRIGLRQCSAPSSPSSNSSQWTESTRCAFGQSFGKIPLSYGSPYIPKSPSFLNGENTFLGLIRISRGLSTAAADPGMSTALRSVGLLDVLLSMSAGASVARLVSTPVCAASLRNLVRKAG